MNASIHNTLLKREGTLNDYSLSSVSVSTSDIDAAENKIDSINEDDNLTLLLDKQREAVKTVSPRNTETDISNTLLGSIDEAALELELLNAWTEGGVKVISPMLDSMLDGIISDGKIEGTEIEDVILIIMLDLMVNQKETGLRPEEQGYLTEWIGSGMHKDRDNNTVDNSVLAEAMKKVLDKGLADQNSVAKKAAEILVSNLNGVENVEQKIDQQMENGNYTSNKDGFYLGTDGKNDENESGSDDCKSVSPIIRLMLLSTAARDNDKLNAEDWDLILTGTTRDIEKLMKEKFTDFVNIFDFIVKNNGQEQANGGSDFWQWYNPDGNGNSGGKFDITGNWLDFNGKGVSLDYLNSMFENFPSRVLSDDELKEINRIGDNVKMIMQTLKYWFQILRDERVAIARNI
ncbi:molecular chaperone [Vibrio cholerae]|uniref:molecular chaperone n=1 Tax=Vibrio cholerae TaxID=666 RepID=UPI00115ACAC1|nr:molecular chaperone [Vibrio cholerae]TQQ30861.1 molecular chaperone [Vibrio cholerae]